MFYCKNQRFTWKALKITAHSDDLILTDYQLSLAENCSGFSSTEGDGKILQNLFLGFS